MSLWTVRMNQSGSTGRKVVSHAEAVAAGGRAVGARRDHVHPRLALVLLAVPGTAASSLRFVCAGRTDRRAPAPRGTARPSGSPWPPPQSPSACAKDPRPPRHSPHHSRARVADALADDEPNRGLPFLGEGTSRPLQVLMDALLNGLPSDLLVSLFARVLQDLGEGLLSGGIGRRTAELPDPRRARTPARCPRDVPSTRGSAGPTRRWSPRGAARARVLPSSRAP